MNLTHHFERSKNPYKSLRIGSGRARKMFWVSMGAGARMDDEKVRVMIKHWQHKGVPPSGVYPLMEMANGGQQFVEPRDLSGELIEWNEKFYKLP